MKLAEMRTPVSNEHQLPSREQLILKYLPYVKRIVNRIAIHLPPNVDTEDLMNVGVIGLIQAIDRYDDSRDNKFTTYAAFRIRGAVLSELRSRDYLSRSNRRKIRDLDRTVLALEQKFDREVDDEEVAAAMDVDLEELYQIKQMSSISFISFEELGYSSARDKQKLARGLLENDGDILAQAGVKELQTALAEAIDELPEKGEARSFFILHR